MLKAVKGRPCRMEAFDYIPNAMFEACQQGSNMSSIKRITRQGQGSLVQIVYLSVKRMQKNQEYLGKGKYSCKT